MKRTTKIRLAIIMPLLVLVACFVGWMIGSGAADAETTKEMKVWGVAGISLCVVLVLFGLFITMARNEPWGTHVVLWTCVAAVLGGIGVKFKSLLLPLSVGISIAVGYAGWMIIGRYCNGKGRHLLRALWFSLCLGPFVAIPSHLLISYDDWFLPRGFVEYQEADYSSSFFLWHLCHGLPAFVLVGGIAFVASLLIARFRQTDESRSTPRRTHILTRVGRGIYVTAMILCVNWYYAGKYDVNDMSQDGDRPLTLQYALISRPGSANMPDGFRRPIILCDDLGTLEILLDRGANPNIAPHPYMMNRGCPLAQDYDPTRLRMLLEAGADPNLKSTY